MKKICIAMLSAGLCAAQDKTPDESRARLAEADARMSEAARKISEVSARTLTGAPIRDASRYDAGTRDLELHRYEDAVRQFQAVVATNSERAEGALYWQAYALNRAGQRDRALQVLEVLRKQYPNGRWLADAQALEAEVKQNAGGAVSPAEESNEDIKLMAINSLMNADPERAIPLLEGLLKGNSPPKVKDRALFVLTQNRSPRAQQILSDYAKGAGNPDLQMHAIRYVGMAGTSEAQQQLAAIYASSNDAAVKRETLRSLMVAKGRDQIFNIAKTEKEDSLRVEGIRLLGAMRATDLLTQLEVGSSQGAQLEIVRAFAAAGAYDKLADVLKNSKDTKVRIEAIRHLSNGRNVIADLPGMYTAETDTGVRREILNALRNRGDAKGLIDIARKESDPSMKRQIVAQLSTMRNNKEATDYMMELLK